MMHHRQYGFSDRSYNIFPSVCGVDDNPCAGASLRKAARSRKYKRLVVLCLSLITLLSGLLIMPTNAYASWPIESQSKISLGYLSKYESSTGKTVTHHGIDISAEAGAKILAPASGEISFVGNVPSDDEPGSATALAVSILLEDGRTVTLLPFSKANVKKGEQISEGDCVGELAASGDRSSPATHLHVGLKRKRIYYDPSELLGISASSESSSEEGSVLAEELSTSGAGLSLQPQISSQLDDVEERLFAEEQQLESIDGAISADALLAYRIHTALQPIANQSPSMLDSFLNSVAELASRATNGISQLVASTSKTMIITTIAFAICMLALAISLVIYVIKHDFSKSKKSRRERSAADKLGKKDDLRVLH